MSDQIEQKQQERAQQNEEISSSTQEIGVPKVLEPISESEVTPESATPVTTCLAQNLDNDDKTPLSTETIEKAPEQSQEQETVQEQQSQEQHRDAGILYTAEGNQVQL